MLISGGTIRLTRQCSVRLLEAPDHGCANHREIERCEAAQFSHAMAGFRVPGAVQS
jgi:hypothetical protein